MHYLYNYIYRFNSSRGVQFGGGGLKQAQGHALSLSLISSHIGEVRHKLVENFFTICTHLSNASGSEVEDLALSLGCDD